MAYQFALVLTTSVLTNQTLIVGFKVFNPNEKPLNLGSNYLQSKRRLSQTGSAKKKLLVDLLAM